MEMENETVYEINKNTPTIDSEKNIRKKNNDKIEVSYSIVGTLNTYFYNVTSQS